MPGAMFVEAFPILPYAAAQSLEAGSEEEARAQTEKSSVWEPREFKAEPDNEIGCVPSQEASVQRRSRRLICFAPGQLPAAVAAASEEEASSASEAEEVQAEVRRRTRRLKHVGAEDLSAVAARVVV